MKVKVYKFLSNNPDDYIYWDAEFHGPQLLTTTNGIYHSTRDPSVYIDCMPNVNNPEMIKDFAFSERLKGE